MLCTDAAAQIKSYGPTAWGAGADEANMLIAQRVDSLDCPPSLKSWMFALHVETMKILQVCLTPPQGTDPYKGLVNLFGQAFVDRVRSPGVQDIQILCSACYSGVAALNILSGYAPEIIRLLFIHGASVYGRTREYAENWSQFVEAERPSVQSGSHPFLENLGQRIFLDMLSAFRLLQPEYPQQALDGWSQIGSKIACDVAVLARDYAPLSDGAGGVSEGEPGRRGCGWEKIRYAALRPVCRNLSSRLARLMPLLPEAPQIFRQQRDEAYAYFRGADNVLSDSVPSEVAGREELEWFTGPLLRLDVDAYLRFIAALHAYHVVKVYGPHEGGIRGLLETVRDAYGLSEGFTTPWLEACSKGDVAMFLVAGLRDNAVAEVLGLKEHLASLYVLLSILEAGAAGTAVSLMNDPDWPAIVDRDMAFFGV